MQKYHIPKQSKKVQAIIQSPPLHVMTVQLKEGEQLAKHQVGRHVLIIVRGGRVIFEGESGTFPLTQDDVFHMHPDTAHSVTAVEDTQFFLIQYDE